MPAEVDSAFTWLLHVRQRRKRCPAPKGNSLDLTCGRISGRATIALKRGLCRGRSTPRVDLTILRGPISTFSWASGAHVIPAYAGMTAASCFWPLSVLMFIPPKSACRERKRIVHSTTGGIAPPARSFIENQIATDALSPHARALRMQPRRVIQLRTAERIMPHQKTVLHHPRVRNSLHFAPRTMLQTRASK